MTQPERAETDPTEHAPAESARPSLGHRDQPDALRPDADPPADRKLPPEEGASPTAPPDGR